jgi:YD repeat-containing protein
MDPANTHSRYYVSYSGVKLPLKLVNELQDSDRDNRNTYFRGVYDAEQRLVRCEKLVYGELELLHVYSYDDNGVLQEAEITDADGEITLLSFDDQGNPLESNE